MSTSRRGWWRANRWWLLALPVALVAMFAASSFRMDFMLLSSQYLRAIEGEQGEWLEVSDPGIDFVGDFDREFRVRVVRVRLVPGIPSDFVGTVEEVPEGMDAYRVALDFEAAPDQLMQGCEVVLVDDQGRQFGGNMTDHFGQPDACVPEDRPGPEYGMMGYDERPPLPIRARPEAWSTSPLVLVPEGASLVSVRIQFDQPEYSEIRLEQ